MNLTPGLIGNLNGIPYTIRDKANRESPTWLNREPGKTPDMTKTISEITKALNDIEGAPDPNKFLIGFDLNAGKPLAAVAIDDLDNAGNVTFNVPGMDTTINDGLKSWVASGQDLHDTQQKTYHDRRLDNPGTAMVSWIG